MSQGNGQSIQSDILDGVVAALQSASLDTYRTRFTDFARVELPACNVVPEDEVDWDETTDDTTLHHRFHVRFMAAKADAADKVADALYVSGNRAILSSPALRAMVTRLHKTGRKWEFERGEVEIVVCVVTYEVEFSTNRSDASVAGF